MEIFEGSLAINSVFGKVVKREWLNVWPGLTRTLQYSMQIVLISPQMSTQTQ